MTTADRTRRRAGARMLCLDRATPDRQTTLADCRIALSIASGVPMDRIDPAQGWDMTDAAFYTARDSWLHLFKTAGKSERYDKPDYDKARGIWARLRPDLIREWPEWGEVA